MKRNPEQDKRRANLEASKLAKEGFLGDDPRALEVIVAADRDALSSLDLTAEDLAGAMRALTALGLKGLGSPIDTKDYVVTVEEYMGSMPCPFRDGKRAAKRNTTAQNKKSGKTLSWTDTSIHLIESHGFFQGQGSSYRLSPVELAEFLGLLPSDGQLPE